MHIRGDNVIFKALGKTKKREDVNKLRVKENEDTDFMNERMKKEVKSNACM